MHSSNCIFLFCDNYLIDSANAAYLKLQGENMSDFYNCFHCTVEFHLTPRQRNVGNTQGRIATCWSSAWRDRIIYAKFVSYTHNKVPSIVFQKRSLKGFITKRFLYYFSKKIFKTTKKCCKTPDAVWLDWAEKFTEKFMPNFFKTNIHFNIF